MEPSSALLAPVKAKKTFLQALVNKLQMSPVGPVGCRVLPRKRRADIPSATLL